MITKNLDLQKSVDCTNCTYCKTGKLLNLRKGVYANLLYTPSYISLEYVLQQAGVVFQYDSRYTSVSYLSREVEVDGNTFGYRRIKEDIIINTIGIIRKDNTNIATPERAFLDVLYLYKDYYFDNLNPLNKLLISKGMEGNPTVLDDISYEALELYRQLRTKVNSVAEELAYNDLDLLRALNCIKKVDNEWKLTNAGLIVFGTKMALRRLMPMVRVDYIRIPGKTWIENPEERFTETLDMRGPIIELVSRTISTIADDLPKGFSLTENSIQAESKSMLPIRVLREAIVNAFIHRTYRVNQPIQILRYSNRIEIINAGYSLKPEESIGEPGSVIRNTFISAIFHDTNLAETKGTGYKTMQKLMKAAQMMPPTFESNRQKNNFTLKLLFHNLLNNDDILWLSNFNDKELNDNQKLALVFLREVGALDNNSYRQLTGASRVEASIDLRDLRNKYLIIHRNAGKSTYYLPADLLLETMVDKKPTMVDKNLFNKIWEELPDSIKQLIIKLGRRSQNQILMEKAILELCEWRELSISELAVLLSRNEKYIKTNYIQPLIQEKKISYTIPEMLSHPNQKYKTSKS